MNDGTHSVSNLPQIRCTCGKVVAMYHEAYHRYINSGGDPVDFFEENNLIRDCCRARLAHDIVYPTGRSYYNPEAVAGYVSPGNLDDTIYNDAIMQNSFEPQKYGGVTIAEKLGNYGTTAVLPPPVLQPPTSVTGGFVLPPPGMQLNASVMTASNRLVRPQGFSGISKYRPPPRLSQPQQNQNINKSTVQTGLPNLPIATAGGSLPPLSQTGLPNLPNVTAGGSLPPLSQTGLPNLPNATNVKQSAEVPMIGSTPFSHLKMTTEQIGTVGGGALVAPNKYEHVFSNVMEPRVFSGKYRDVGNGLTVPVLTGSYNTN